MSLCHTEYTSCIACCIGDYINLPRRELEEKILFRTKIFNGSENPIIYYKDMMKIDPTICSFIGIVNYDAVGCLIYPIDEEDIRSSDSIARQICSKFECSAKQNFDDKSDEEKQHTLISLSNLDWYELSKLISILSL